MKLTEHHKIFLEKVSPENRMSYQSWYHHMKRKKKTIEEMWEYKKPKKNKDYIKYLEICKEQWLFPFCGAWFRVNFNVRGFSMDKLINMTLQEPDKYRYTKITKFWDSVKYTWTNTIYQRLKLKRIELWHPL